ncbi:MAG TPA: hypothetical protein VHE30_01815 [Polyangiaceae bacterium]|nr:hypothetical protein [Polyangiaceae bacterium]
MTTESKGRWLGGVLIVAVTFAAAYYLPLHRTHSRLVTEYGALAERATAVEKELATARAEAAAATEKAASLARSRKTEDTQKQKHEKLIDAVYSDVDGKLGADSGLSARKKDDGVVVRLDGASLKAVRDHVEVAAPAAKALCAVAADVTSDLRVTVTSSGAGKGSKSPWESSSDRAAAVARVLADKCGLVSDRLSTAARVGGDGSVEIRVESNDR